MAHIRTGCLALTVIALIGAGTSNAIAQSGPNPPEILAYQGYLTDGGGNALGNPNPKNYDVIFRIWKSESGAATADRLWSEQQTVTVDNGFFSVMLGEGGPPSGEAAPALSTVFSGNDASERWVGITVKGIASGGGDLDILPRLRLLTSPFSFLANKARTMEATGLTGTVPLEVMNSNIARRDVANIFSSNQTIQQNVTVGGTHTVNTSQRINGPQTVTGTATFAGQVTANRFSGNGTIPIGGIIMWSGTTPPNGWALCDGSNGTPDLRGRFVLGSGNASGLTSRTSGQTGGAERVALTATQMPVHNHNVNPAAFTISGGRHRHTIDADYGSGVGSATSGDRVLRNTDGGDSEEETDDNDSHTHTVDVPNTTSTDAGGSQSHENMPPFHVLAYIIRTQ